MNNSGCDIKLPLNQIGCDTLIKPLIDSLKIIKHNFNEKYGRDFLEFLEDIRHEPGLTIIMEEKESPSPPVIEYNYTCYIESRYLMTFIFDVQISK